MKKEILLGLTTTKDSDWRQKIVESKALNITSVALFLTGLQQAARQELYKLLEASPIKQIPHVHLRTDMELWELDYLLERYKVVAFNIHPESHYPWLYDYSKYPGQIFIENIGYVVGGIATRPELARYSGLCLDFAHMENRSLRFGNERDTEATELLDYIKKYPIGCCHISAIKKEPTDKVYYENVSVMYDAHSFSELSEFDYMKKYVQYLPQYISLELENTFAEQLVAKKYLEKILGV